MSVIVDAAAKLNLFLEIQGRRADGFHLLNSLMVCVSPADRLEVAAPAPAHGAREQAQAPGALSLTINGPFKAALAKNDNLVLKAAAALRRRLSAPWLGASMTLVKNLPVAAGVGGGSADAAAALRALSALWRTADLHADLHDCAAALGADIPYCLYGRPALVSGIGERISPAPMPPKLAVTLVWPNAPLPTASVFARFAAGADGAGEGRGAGGAGEAPIHGWRSAGELTAMLRRRRNDLTKAAIALAPPVGEALLALKAQPGCLLARMSGSGSTCFALFTAASEAKRAASAIQAARPFWWTSAGRILSQPPPVRQPAGGAPPASGAPPAAPPPAQRSRRSPRSAATNAD